MSILGSECQRIALSAPSLERLLEAEASVGVMVRCVKYTLFASPNASYARCAFYGTPAGCRSGAACAFTHTAGQLGNTPDKKEEEPRVQDSEVERVRLALAEQRRKRTRLEAELAEQPTHEDSEHDEAQRLRAQIAALREANERKRQSITPTFNNKTKQRG